jgi:hypothetical protein
MASSTGGSGWRSRSTRFLVSIAALVLVVVLVGGVAIGYAIEHNRSHTKKATKTTQTKPGALTGKQVRVAGVITSVTPNVVKIKLKGGAVRTVFLQKTTIIGKASAGAASDIAASTSKVTFVAKSAPKGAPAAAAEVLVLPKSARFGVPVSAADGSSMTLKVGAKKVRVTTTGATVVKAAVTTRADLKAGAKVVLQAGKNKSGALVALEVVVLPSGSAFA